MIKYNLIELESYINLKLSEIRITRVHNVDGGIMHLRCIQ